MPVLTFIETTNIDGFKRVHNCTKIDIIANPKKPGNHFIAIDSDEKFRGAVSGDLKEVMANPAFSLVEGTEGQFWMLHKKQSSNVVASL